MSLRARILIGTGLAMLVGLVVVGTVTYSLFTRSQLKQVDDILRRASRATEQIAEQGGADDRQVIPQIASGLFVAIVDPSGMVVFSDAVREAGEAPSTVDIADVDLARQYQTVQASDGDDIRLRSDPLRRGSTLLVGQSLHEVNETSSRLLGVLAGASAVAIASTVVLAWWLVNVGLRPLRAVESSAAAITDEDLGDARVPALNPNTEVGRLAHALNAMLDRLDAARAERQETVDALRTSEARMRQFVADASHELRTPMAATAAYTELFDAGARNHPADLERAMSGIRSETARMASLVDDLLLLALLDEQRPLDNETVDFTEIVLAAIDAARTLEPARQFDLKISGVIEIDGDKRRLRQVIDNLLANIRTHTPDEARCEIDLSVQDRDVVLTVTDTGPGVDAKNLARLGDRFYRIDDARTRSNGGSGLGLSIITAIVGAHQGTVSFASNEPSGLAVTIFLPTSTNHTQDRPTSRPLSEADEPT